MSSLEERVAYLDGRMEDHAALFADIRAETRGLRAEMRAEMTASRAEMRAEMTAFRAETTAFRSEMDRRFTWTIGLLVGVLMGMVGLAFQISRLQPL